MDEKSCFSEVRNLGTKSETHLLNKETHLLNRETHLLNKETCKEGFFLSILAKNEFAGSRCSGRVGSSSLMIWKAELKLFAINETRAPKSPKTRVPFVARGSRRAEPPWGRVPLAPKGRGAACPSSLARGRSAAAHNFCHLLNKETQLPQSA